jgi:hypothetical protein
VRSFSWGPEGSPLEETGKLEDLVGTQSVAQMTERFERLDKALASLPCMLTKGRIASALRGLQSGMTNRELKNRIGEMHNFLRGELASYVFYAVAPEMVPYAEPQSPLWSDKVNEAFPDIRFDIAEAAKCLALNRPTASAFHSLRALEAGLQALARCLDIEDPMRGPERTWGSVLRSIKNELDRRWPHAKDRFDGQGKIFSALYASLAAIQNPYRDATMHLEKKYNPEDAIHIFVMVKGLMAKIAEQMDENGEPKA